MEENVKKKTGRFGRFLGWLLSIVLLLLLADGMEAAYPKITEGARKIYSQDPGELQEESARRYTQEAADLIYGMYVDWYYHMYSTDAEPGSLLLGIKDTKQSAYVMKFKLIIAITEQYIIKIIAHTPPLFSKVPTIFLLTIT